MDEAGASAMQTIADEVLIARIAKGDRSAMEALFARYRVRVFKFVLRVVRNEAIAEELNSDVFVDVWRQAGTFEGRAAVSTWIFSIARFKALNALARRTEDELDEGKAETIEDDADDPETALAKKDKAAVLRQCLAALSRDEQIHCGPIEEVQLDHWHRGHVVLIGDAAHAGAPTMGQGGIMAMEDAYVLAALLRGAETAERALDSYETRRKPRATWVQQQSRSLLESFLMPPAQRNPVFRERGNQMMHDSFAPLIPAP